MNGLNMGTWRKLLGRALLVAAFGGCGGVESVTNETLGENESNLLTVITPADPMAGTPDCGAATVKLVNTAGSSVDWQTMNAQGAWEVSGANGVALEYLIDNVLQAGDSSTVMGTLGTWSYSTSGLACRSAVYNFQVCAIPKIRSDQGETTCNTKRTCAPWSFRACPNAVGIIRDLGAFCPAGSDIISITTDDEDTSTNNNTRNGWIGLNSSTTNTRFNLCKVDGNKFKPLSNYDEIQWHYALLKLGEACPPGSTEFGKKTDNEDTTNSNSNTGNIWPNSQNTDVTNFRFCLFRNGTPESPGVLSVPTMSAFPDVGFPYGVFAGASFSTNFALSMGHIYSDDENTDNSNAYYIPANAPANTKLYATQIISDGTNTTFRMAKVK